MESDEKKLLVRIRNTLNGIEVRGTENLNGLLGCIQALDSLIAEEDEDNAGE